MALIDALRDLADLPESHIPALNEIQQIVGKLAAYAEHGDGFFKAAEAGAEDVAELLAKPTDTPNTTEADHPAVVAAPVSAPAAGEPAPTPADATVPTPDTTDPAAATSADKDAEIAALKQQLALAQANAQRTQVSAEPDSPAQTAPTTAAPTPETW